VATRFELLRVEPIFHGHVFDVERHHLRGDDTEFDREVVSHPGAVAVLPVDAEGRLLLLRQFRAPTRGRVLEIPAGTCDVADEPSEAAARRELLEETGFVADELVPLGTFFNSPGYSSQATTVYVATGLRMVGATPSGIEEEDIRVVAASIAEARQWIRSGEIRCAITALAIELAAESLRG
jgi:8-oxo-dGTP pyrophosphatase MutT (NUDIX family)